MTHKSEDLAKLAEQNGWRTQIQTNMGIYEETGDINDIGWIFYALRGEEDKRETLRVTWKGDLQESAFYKYGDYTLRPARKAPVVKLITGQPDPKKFRRVEEKSKPITIEDKLAGKNVPWGSDPPAFDVLVGVIGKTITWISPTTGQERTEPCTKAANLGKSHFKLKTTKAGKRVLEWASTTGFCACYLDSIIDVT